MKKFLYVLCIVMISALMVGCGKKKEEIKQDTSVSQEKPVETVKPEATEEPVVETPEEIWGMPSKATVSSNSDITHRIYINYPIMLPIRSKGGYFAPQDNGTLVSMATCSGSDEYYPFPNSLEEVLDCYGIIACKQVEELRGSWDYENFALTQDNSSYVTRTINLEENNEYVEREVEMLKTTGKLTYTYLGESQAISYVAYSALAPEVEGGYMYWMVLDDSEDQSLGNLIDEYASKMADSLIIVLK